MNNSRSRIIHISVVKFLTIDFLNKFGLSTTYLGRYFQDEYKNISINDLLVIRMGYLWLIFSHYFNRRFGLILRLQPKKTYHLKTPKDNLFSTKLSLHISGKLALPIYNCPQVKTLAIITLFNERDIIIHVIDHLLEQGLDVYIIDNWSKDGSYEIIKSKGYDERVKIERYPKVDSKQYDWTTLLNRVTEVAKQNKQYDWIMHNDADEIRSSPWAGVSLASAISFVDASGYNSIDFTVFDFRPTIDGYDGSIKPQIFFTHGEFGNRPGHFVQIKLWKNNSTANLVKSGGHHVYVENQKIFPLKFFLGHYPLRSNIQAREKIFMNRKPRFMQSEKSIGWHTHYDHIKKNENFIRNKSELIAFNDQFYEKYLIERISGIGIAIKE